MQAAQEAVADIGRTVLTSRDRLKQLGLQLRKASLDVESDVKKSQELQAQVSALQTASKVRLLLPFALMSHCDEC